MDVPLEAEGSALAPKLAAPQHKPRPLPLFLEMLRRETAGNPERMARALKGLRAYQEATRPEPMPLMPAVAEVQGAKLRDYGGDGPLVLFVPSLINPPNILDLSPSKSLLRWLTAKGHHVLLLDWGWDGAERRNMSVSDHVASILVPLIETLDEPPALAGYCLGGTMVVAAAVLTKVRSVVTIAAPWHFSGVSEEARERLARLWSQAAPTVHAMGLLPMEILQSSFWSLDPARSISKFEAFAEMEPDSADARAFVTLEDWANDGPPVSEAAAREIFEDFFAADLPGSAAWKIEGRAIQPSRFSCPLLNVASTRDAIVPHATSIRTGERIDLALGHVGMVVGGRAQTDLWQPLDAWLSRTASD